MPIVVVNGVGVWASPERKPAIVFGYHVLGPDGSVYRYARTTKTYGFGSGVEEDQRRFVERLGLGFRGLNTPDEIILFQRVTFLDFAWTQLHGYLKREFGIMHPETDMINIKRERQLGDSWFTADASTEQLKAHLAEMVPILRLDIK